MVQIDRSSGKITVHYENDLDMLTSLASSSTYQIDVTYKVKATIVTTSVDMVLDTYIFTLKNPCVETAYSNITGQTSITYSYTIG